MFALVISANCEDRPHLSHRLSGPLEGVRFGSFDIHLDERGSLEIPEVIDSAGFDAYAAPARRKRRSGGSLRIERDFAGSIRNRVRKNRDIVNWLIRRLREPRQRFAIIR